MEGKAFTKKEALYVQNDNMFGYLFNLHLISTYLIAKCNTNQVKIKLPFISWPLSLNTTSICMIQTYLIYILKYSTI